MSNRFAELERWSDGPLGVFGTLRVRDGFECYTVENNWLDNRRWVSCIPVGRYKLRRGTFRGRYSDLEFVDVPGRDRIEIHGANRATDLQGCIAPGRRLGMLGGEWAVRDSMAALVDLMRAFDTTDHDSTIEIVWRPVA